MSRDKTPNTKTPRHAKDLDKSRCGAISKEDANRQKAMTMYAQDERLKGLWLTAPELKAASAACNASVVTIARAFDADDRTARRWVSGDLLVPAGVSVLIRLLVSLKRKLSYRDMATALRHEADLLDALADVKDARTAAPKPAEREAQAAA